MAEPAPAETWRTAHEAALLPALGRPQRLLTHGSGARVWDAEGREYLDLLAGIAVNALGHAHPDYVRAVSEQAATLGQISNYFASEPQIALAGRLLALAEAPAGSAVYFCNSGAEANEAALKMARRVPAGPGGAPRTTIVAVEGSFHGRTMGALAMTSKEAFRAPFEPGVPGIRFVPFGDEAALRAAVDETCQAVIVEPIQGEGGVRNHPAGYLRAAREATREAGALLVLDEVQTGIGRCGAWFALQRPDIGEGIVPDVVTLAKGLGGGLPIGATIAFGSSAAHLLQPGQHGSTFAGNPIVTAAAGAVLDVIERDGLVAAAQDLGERLASALMKADGVTAVSGAGLLRAFELPELDSHDVVAAALEAGFICNAVSAHRVRLAPPLIVSAEQLDAFTAALPDIIAAAARRAKDKEKEAAA
ncbi:acetylornithine transaminase [Brevibacterium sp. BRM-1]|uniref:acetylornithine transaminase n=1 Tax=Brevibacterium sp. BRM-1 TaxID=2999062 RepID=UPI0022810095|nr:acetylornithine transaminase [Brevibacterium sp. BRM-1]WAL41172.1 acetylornithine transaminase [Brevibacterium sp. BRM-1]